MDVCMQIWDCDEIDFPSDDKQWTAVVKHCFAHVVQIGVECDDRLNRRVACSCELRSTTAHRETSYGKTIDIERIEEWRADSGLLFF